MGLRPPEIVRRPGGVLAMLGKSCAVLRITLIPIDAYPEWLQRICRALPFQYLYYAPARLFVRPETGYWLEVLAMLGIIGAGGALALMLAYHLGLRQVSAQGG